MVIPASKLRFYPIVRALGVEAAAIPQGAQRMVKAVLHLWRQKEFAHLAQSTPYGTTALLQNTRVQRFAEWLISQPFNDAAFWLATAYATWVGDEVRSEQALYFTPPKLADRVIDDLVARGASLSRLPRLCTTTREPLPNSSKCMAAQARVADLCGLSTATVEQVENGSIGDLDWAHTAHLLSVLGLSVRVSNPRSTRRQREDGTLALEVASRSASTSYREILSAEDLRTALLTTTYPKNLMPYVRAFLEEAPLALIADVVEQLHHETGVSRVKLWQHMRDMGRASHTTRDIWL